MNSGKLDRRVFDMGRNIARAVYNKLELLKLMFLSREGDR